MWKMEWVDVRGRSGSTLATAHEAGQVGGVSAVLLRGPRLVSGAWDMKLKASPPAPSPRRGAHSAW